MSRTRTDCVRLAELVATLSYAADLGLGQPMAHCMRQTVIALRLAELAGATEAEREATYYLGLMFNAYCHADAAEQASWFGDDISFKSAGFDLLGMNTAQLATFLVRRVGGHGTGLARARRLAGFPRSSMKRVMEFLTTHARLGAQFAEQIGLDRVAVESFRDGYEQWDGKGVPQGSGEPRSRCPPASSSSRDPWRCTAAGTARSALARPCGATAVPTSTRQSSTSSAGMRPTSSTVSTRQQGGRRSSTPNRAWRGG